MRCFATIFILAVIVFFGCVGCGGSTPVPAQHAPTPDISGYWSGDIKSSLPNSAAKGSLRLVLTETGDNVTGTSDVENHCFDEFSLVGNLLGDFFSATITTDDGAKINLTGAIHLDAKSVPDGISANYQITHGTCTGDTGTIQFGRPKVLPI